MDCNQIRQKIRNLVNSGDLKKSQFCKLVFVSEAEYDEFMKKRTKLGGDDSKVFKNARDFFNRRELNGMEEPAPKKRRISQDSAGSASDGTSKKKAQDKGGIPDLSDIHLDGEDADEVPIYDSCGEIRKKISAYLRRNGVEQSKLLKAFKEQYHTDKQPARMDSGKLRRFRNAKGADVGNTNSIFYAAYVFFEKLRIKEGKPKSQHRQDMERAWPQGADTKVAARNKG
ncbi:MAG: hypothetical protein M1821_006619 [Bathelium mastoideum]|nr:MAG: hypothetical protein M1821_006619 [Bathelium mastoideum]